MATTGVDLDWEVRFLANDTPWERQGVHPAILHWQRAGALTQGASIYIPGCGRGAEPLALSEAGLEVTASDMAPSAAAYQREALSDYSSTVVVEGDSLAWRPETPFDLLYEQTFLCAIHPHLRGTYERMAYDLLKPGGKLLALFMQKNERGGPPYGCSLPAMKELFTQTRWIWPEQKSFVPFPHPNLNNKAELAGVLTRL